MKARFLRVCAARRALRDRKTCSADVQGVRVRASKDEAPGAGPAVAQGPGVVHDESGRIQSANPSAERILGLSFDQMTGRTAVDPRWRLVTEDGSPLPWQPASCGSRRKAPSS